MTLADDFTMHVFTEIYRARDLFPGQEETLTPHEWYAILAEEVGEVARGLNEGGISGPGPLDRDALYQELVQVAAMAGRMALSVKNGGIDASKQKDATHFHVRALTSQQGSR